MRVALSLSLGSTVNGKKIIVTNSSELVTAMTNAKGGQTIYVAPNATPYNISVSNLVKASEVKIVPLDVANKPNFDRFLITSCKNITLSGMNFPYNASIPKQIVLTTCTACRVYNNTANGGATQYDDGTVTVGVRGIEIASCDDTVISGNILTGHAFAIYCGGVNNNTLVENNDVSINQRDSYFFVGEFHGLTIRGNNSYKQLGALWSINHGDHIQFSNTGGTGNWSDILVENNFFISFSGASKQCIFMSDDRAVGAAWISDLVVRYNFIVGNSYHGISITNGTNVSIYGNTVLFDKNATGTSDGSLPGGSQIPSINVAGTMINCLVSDNISEKFIGVPANGNTLSGITASNNIRISSAAPYGNVARERYYSDVLGKTTIAQIKQYRLPANLNQGPLSMRDGTISSLPAPTVNPNPELMTDTGADTPASWYVASGVVVSGSKVNYSKNNNFFGAAPITPLLTSGVTYVVMFSVESYVGGQFNLRELPAAITATTDTTGVLLNDDGGTQFKSNADYMVLVTPTQSCRLNFRAAGSAADFTWKLDNFSIRQL